ncbi:MAG: hypothetical protein Q3M24_00380 [Candidatus Electrothrix aestuarii]|uniref:Uncharacterized protein n=1 Tax=Candidatus Electrothrix aestuarii TaxID=3062594 RepID=A0AAU8LVF0_9BACT|nr:hypothetical protein [Candidatus Electrothrix aestuarii]
MNCYSNYKKSHILARVLASTLACFLLAALSGATLTGRLLLCVLGVPILLSAIQLYNHYYPKKHREE